MRPQYPTFALLPLFVWIALPATAQLVCSPSRVGITTGYPGKITITDKSGGNVQFKYAGTGFGFPPTPVPAAADLLVVIPSSGVTPATVYVAVNPNVAAQHGPTVSREGELQTAQFVSVGQNPASTATVDVTIVIPPDPPPGIRSVVNAASLKPVISPGAMVSIFGSNLAGVTQSAAFDNTGSFPKDVAGTAVTFNGIPAPLLYVSPGQVNAIAPFALAGQTSAQVVAYHFQQASEPGSPPIAGFPLPLQDTAPAIFTVTQTGSGQAAAQQQGSNAVPSNNSLGNPAHAGDYVTFFATGQGIWTPPAPADVFMFPESFTTQPVSVTIGGQPAKVLYSGSMGGTLVNASVLQVNAVVPSGLAPGPQPLVLTIGANNNSAQNVIVYVQ